MPLTAEQMTEVRAKVARMVRITHEEEEGDRDALAAEVRALGVTRRELQAMYDAAERDRSEAIANGDDD